MSGAFGDIGTDLPLLAGMVIASGIDPGRVFLVFGLLQIASALIYGIPMPVQPLKAVAALVIAQQIGAPVIAGAALSVAAIMLFLTVSGALDGLARLIPKVVVRGIQFGLGLKLGLLAVGRYVIADGVSGGGLATLCFILALLLLRKRRLPASVIVVAIGMAYALALGVPLSSGNGVAAWRLPMPALPTGRDIWLGLVLLALPQVPLSIGNSMLATKQLADDWFPERGVTLRQIRVTYSLFNGVVALFGGVPVCHGSGGMAGHYAFGGRTGGSVAIYGLFLIALGLACAFGLDNITALFPLPVLGVILFFEGVILMSKVRDVAADRIDLAITLVVGLTAAWLPYGFLIGMAGGSLLVAFRRQISSILTSTAGLLRHDTAPTSNVRRRRCPDRPGAAAAGDGPGTVRAVYRTRRP